ncbi:histone deacetylase [candidate division WOR-3 bacterium]|nr:histone deacetylase [candidate division WOR-3 bacterium]
MKFVYSERYRFDVGVHVFPTEKYKMVREGLLAEGLARAEDFVEPPEPSVDDIRLVHTKEYVDDLLNLRWTARTVRSELPLTWEIVQGFFLHASGTILACQLALNDGVAMNIGGGFHHAFAEHGEGFCYINDIAVAIKKLQKDGKLERAAVIDCDLHQGNGTARIFQNDPRVYTFSIHQEHLYPIKERSDWDIGLEDETGDEEYNRLMKEAVPKIISEHRPQLVVYVAGADPYFNDQLGTLRLTKRGLALRDRIVLENCHKAGIPVATVLAGGYALDTKDTAEIHINTAKECLRVLGQLPSKSTEEIRSNPNESETASA